MKKLLCIMALCVGFMACSSDDKHKVDIDTNPIKGLELPKSDKDQPLVPGQEITIKGEGFTESSEIWFKTLVKTTNESIKAEVSAVNKAGITFVAPDVSGSQTVSLKQSGKEYLLGTMFFKDAPKVVKKRTVKWIRNEKALFEFTYNDKNQLIKILNREDELIHQFEYNDLDQLVSATETDIESKKKTTDKKFTYKDVNTILVDEVYYDDPESNGTMTITLDENGLITKLADNVQFYNTYDYDKFDNLVRLTENYYGHLEDKFITSYTYDNKISYLANHGLPKWFWLYEAYDNFMGSAGTNNGITQTFKGDTKNFKFDYDELGYPTVMYKEQGEEPSYVENMKFVYEVMK